MDENTPPAGQVGIAPRRQEIRPYIIALLEPRTSHQRFSSAEPLFSKWRSSASQRHVRDIAVDNHRGRIWLATWGGVLCWMPEVDLCVRHTSEHGLVGNA